MPRWSVDIIRKRAEHLGEVDAPDEQAAIKRAPTPSASPGQNLQSAREGPNMVQSYERPGIKTWIFFCLGFGLLAVAAVPGVGWMWGQFYETITLCIGIVPLAYAA